MLFCGTVGADRTEVTVVDRDASNRTAGQPRFIPTLDGWRAIAALLVIVSHEFREHGSPLAVPLGAAGVKIFFALSGYLICTLLLLEQKEHSRISLRNFYIRRAFRILPPAFTYLGFLLIATALGWRLIDLPSVWKCVLLMANNLTPAWLVNHFWTLSLEEQFYLLWPAVLAFAGIRRAAWIAGSAIVLISVWRAVYGLLFHSVPVNRSDMTLDVFFAPCLLAILLSEPRYREAVRRHLNVLVLMVMVAVLAACELLHFGPDLRKTVMTLVMPLVIVSTVLHPEWSISSILETRVLRWVGRMSYSLYLWQQFFTSDRLPGPMPLRIIALFLTAAASYYFIEEPFIRAGRNLIQRWPGAVPRPSSLAQARR